MTTLIFNQPYNICPRYPNGTKWEVYARGRFGSCCWNMKTFAAALAYLRQQWGYAARDSKLRRHPGDEHSANEFRGWINGPGGRIEWNDLETLVKGETK
jgi:hypothetical protein